VTGDIMKKPEYILCPRCELNYFIEEKKRKHCDVCLAELNLGNPDILIPDEDVELERFCPFCKVNYMSPDEEMCFICAKERTPAEVEESAEDWAGFMDEEPEPIDDPVEISLEELGEQEQEEEDFEEEPIDGDDDF